MAGSPQTFAARVTLPDAAPIATSGTLFIGAGTVSVSFDQPLRILGSGTTAWTVTPNVGTVTLTNPRLLTQSAIRFDAAIGGGPPASATIDYAPPPDQVRNLRLVPATPFAGLTLNVFP